MDVGLSGQVSAMEPESESSVMQSLSHEDFRLGVLRFNTSHHLTAFCL